jgi:hypothetical protein
MSRNRKLVRRFRKERVTASQCNKSLSLEVEVSTTGVVEFIQKLGLPNFNLFNHRPLQYVLGSSRLILQSLLHGFVIHFYWILWFAINLWYIMKKVEL